MTSTPWPVPPENSGAQRDRLWWITPVVAAVVLPFVVIMDAGALFMLMWGISDSCDPDGPAMADASHQAGTAVIVALVIVVACLIGTLALPHRMALLPVRIPLGVLAVLAAAWPTVWMLLIATRPNQFAGC